MSCVALCVVAMCSICFVLLQEVYTLPQNSYRHPKRAKSSFACTSNVVIQLYTAKNTSKTTFLSEKHSSEAVKLVQIVLLLLQNIVWDRRSDYVSTVEKISTHISRIFVYVLY